MNLKDESRSSSGMTLEELIQMNGEVMAALEEVPYQPIVYAVPKEWLENWMKLLEIAVQFQPTLYEKITPLATQAEMQKQEVNLKADVEMAKREMLNSIGDWKKQDGNLKEEFFSKLSAQHSAAVEAIKTEYEEQQKKRKRLMWITISASAVLSGLVSGLCLLLGG